MRKMVKCLSPFLAVTAIAVILLFGCGGDNGLNGGDEDTYIAGSAVYNGDLFVAKGRYSENQYNVSRLSGSGWQTIGTGINDWCGLLCAGDSGLYMAGDFTTVSGVAANHIARWDGTN
ncbi:MAG: hypothetical protein JRJ14_01910, partial [Deltaproteobacteria bacterium]|nr:hypothetical protein [Deltaproteobacteria bacterium]